MKPLLFLALTTATTLAQGPLLPPAAPASTMKTLAQIEARTPIPASPAIPIAGPHFTITQPGSYYLAGNITVSTGDGIRITAASDVSIDLNGFTISSVLIGSASGTAIHCASTCARLTVKNGSLVSGSTPPSTLQGFQDGIRSSSNLVDAISEALISGVHVKGMAAFGFFLSQGSIVENCTANSNGDTGIYAAQGRVIDSIATNNGADGIIAYRGSVTSSTAFSNRENGIRAIQSSITRSTSTNNGRDGISAEQSVVSDCRALGNNTNSDAFVGVGIRWPNGKIQNSLADTATPTIP